MSTQIQLQWSVDASKTPLTPGQAQAKLAAVPLYQDPVTDPVLGQALALRVVSDNTVTTVNGAQRTLVLAMTSPPPFPCHPDAQTPPVLPYTLEKTVPLAGTFTVQNGSSTVVTQFSQKPALSIGDRLQFESQLGVVYTVGSVSSGSIGLTGPYLGTFANTKALKTLAAPAKLPALYSTSPLDTSVNGSGAASITIGYVDSLGNGGTVTAALFGKRPAPITLAGGTIDIAIIDSMTIASTGGFGCSVGQITLVDLSEPIVNTGIADTDDEAQMKIDRALTYLPPSYFALAQQGAAAPPLEGDFEVNPDSVDVISLDDQTGVLSAGNDMEFASNPGEIYTVNAVTPKIITLNRKYAGLVPTITGATRTSPSMAAPPTDDQLKALMAQYVNPGNTSPSQAMIPAPVFLSDFFTHTLSLALAVPVTSNPITLS